jgi:hypothetical protein
VTASHAGERNAETGAVPAAMFQKGRPPLASPIAPIPAACIAWMGADVVSDTAAAAAAAAVRAIVTASWRADAAVALEASDEPSSGPP